MPYVERVTKAGNTIEIERYFTSRYKKKGISRGDKVKPTKEEQEKVNTRQAERKLRILINANYIWNMAHVEDGEKYYIRKEYTEVSELHKGSEQPVIIQQVQQQTEPAAGEEPQNGQEEKEGVNNAS